jgi:peptidoglycan-N-acetylglucosamine deacetylase
VLAALAGAALAMLGASPGALSAPRARRPRASTAAAGTGAPTTPTTPTGPATPTTPSPSPPPPKPPPPSPRSYLYHPVGCVRRGAEVSYSSGPGYRKVVALSFDDGPWPDTAAFVRMLESRHVPATFFMIGEQVTSAYRSTLQRELRDGDALGDHTFTHPYLTQTGNVYGQLHSTIVAIRRLTGYTPCVFRPPYGAIDQSIIRTAASLGLATILWNVDPSDWALPGTEAIVQRVLAQVRPGSIVLSHDGGGPRGETLAAYPRIISVLKQRGYRFETVPQLLGFHTVYRRCRRECDGAAVRWPLPPGSIVER